MRRAFGVAPVALIAMVAGGAQAQRAEVTRVAAEIEAMEAARFRGDTGAWKLPTPDFYFLHSTGGVDDRAAMLARRSGATAPGPRNVRTLRAEPPIYRLDGDVFTKSVLLEDSVAAGVRAGRSRALDVYVKRDGLWLWAAHLTTEVRPRWAPIAADSAVLSEYAGTYTATNGGRRIFAIRGGKLVQAGAVEREVIPLSESTFGYDGLKATVMFARDRSGKVVAADESSAVAFIRFARTP